MRRVFVVHNPVAGTHNPEILRAALQEHFCGEEWACEVHQTDGAERIVRTVGQALDQGLELVVVAGGDGTVSSVAGGLVGTGTPLGIVPIGTSNSLARELGIPLEVEEALSVLRGAYGLVGIDGMQIDDRTALLNIGVGLSPRIIENAARGAKRRLGRLAYIWAGLKGVLGFQPQRFTLSVDGTIKTVRAAEILVANSGTLGVRALRWAQEIRLDDGCLNLCIVRARSAPDYLQVAWHLLIRQARRSNHVRCMRVERTVTIDASRPLPVQADGDIIGQTPARVRFIPAAVQVVVPG